MSLFQQSGSSSLDRQASLAEWRRIWAPAAPVIDPVAKMAAQADATAVQVRSAWSGFSLSFVASTGATEDGHSATNRVAAMKAYAETGD